MQHKAQTLCDPTKEVIMTRTLKASLLIALLGVILVSEPGLNGLSTNEEETAEKLKPVLEAYELILERYYEPESIEKEELVKGAVQGMVDALSGEYSKVFTKEEYDRLKNRMEGRIEGLGLELVKSSEGLKILEIFPRTPASRSELKTGDEILSIGGKSTKAMDLDDVQEKIRGKDGTEVDLNIRGSGGEEELITLTQNLFQMPPVQLELLADGTIALFDINRFTSNASREFQSALSELNEEELHGYIIDLRNNRGGYVDEALEVAEKFVDEGKLVKSITREEVRTPESRGNDLPNLPLVILLNENTASAAETLAGVLKDKKVGVLAGRRTLGKKVGQSSTAIGGKLFLKLTTGKSILPSGEGVPEKGLEPDLSSPVFTEDLEVAIEWIEEHKGERFPQEQED